MSILWRKRLDDNFLVYKLDDGSFVFLRDDKVKDEYVPFIKVENIEVQEFTLSVHPNIIDFEVQELTYLDKHTVIAHLLSGCSINPIVDLLKNKYKIILTDEIIDDMEAIRLARRMNGE